MTPLVEVLLKTTQFFKEKGIPSPRLDAELLIGHALGMDRMQLYLNFERPLTTAELEAVRPLIKRRGNREPVAWITGHREFWEDTFTVTPGVLVPRPDTEALVELAIKRIGEGDPVYVADVGCGSGCIGLSVAHALPGVRLFAIDRSPEAIACTRANVAALKLDQRVAILSGDLLAPIPAGRPVDWVLSNPPYIPTADIEGLAPEVQKHEPRLALDGGPDGLDVYRRLIPDAARRARVGVMVEVGAGQAPMVAQLMQAAGLQEIEIQKDLSGIERVVAGKKPTT